MVASAGAVQSTNVRGRAAQRSASKSSGSSSTPGGCGVCRRSTQSASAPTSPKADGEGGGMAPCSAMAARRPAAASAGMHEDHASPGVGTTPST